MKVSTNQRVKQNGTPQIELLGVYSLRVTGELVREEAECRYDNPSSEEEEEMREELSVADPAIGDEKSH